MSKAYIVGVGMTQFLKPDDENPEFDQLVQVAAQRALRDATITYQDIEAAIGGYIYGDATCAQRAAYLLGMTGIPIYNINNNGGTGASTIHLGSNLVRGGIYEAVMSFGFEKMEKGSLKALFPQRHPAERLVKRSFELNPDDESMLMAPRIFGHAALDHMRKYGTTIDQFASISVKNYRNGARNPYAQFQSEKSIEQIKNSRKIHGILTLLQCSPTTDGAACVIICSEHFMKKHKLEDQAIQICGSSLTTDTEQAWKDNMELAGYSMAERAAEKAYKQANVKPEQIQVAQVHDCFSSNELITYEAMKFCAPGRGGGFVDRKMNDYGGQVVVNPSGGLISRGHPIGATGVAQCVELAWQLRGISGQRQVMRDGRLPKYALQHTIGLGGACVVSIFKKHNGNGSPGTSCLREMELAERPNPKL